MNAYDVNRNNKPNENADSIRRIFPKNGNKFTRTIDASLINDQTKTCLLSINESSNFSSRIQTLWYTFDGSIPSPTNGHKMTSKSRLELSSGAVKAAKFANQPGAQSGEIVLLVDQLTN